MDRQAQVRWSERGVCRVRAFPCGMRSTLQWSGELERSSAAVLRACLYLKKINKKVSREKKKNLYLLPRNFTDTLS